MPVTPTYPGVYIEEIPSGVRTITGVATSITAFIGRALSGPVNEPVTINNFGDFERVFGGLWIYSTLGYAVRDFFLNGGGQAIIVRLFRPTSTVEELNRGFAAANAVLAAVTKVANATSSQPSAALVAAAAREEANKPENLTDPIRKGIASYLAWAAEEEAKKTTATPQSILAVVKGTIPWLTIVNRTLFTVGTNNLLYLEAVNEGAWGNDLRMQVDCSVKTGGSDEKELFNLLIKDNHEVILETIRNVSVGKDHPRRVDKVLMLESRFVRTQGTLPSARPEATAAIWYRRASDGQGLTTTEYKGNRASKTGLYALEKVDTFNLLCMPPPTFEKDFEDVVIWSDAAKYCEERRAMLLVDPPRSWSDKGKAKDGLTSLLTNQKNAALFFPRLRQPDPLRSNTTDDFAPCGAIAGIFARTDAQRGVWKAPAGLEATLVGVPQLSVNLTDAENGELNQIGINCLRTLPAAGHVVWGARTLQGDDRLASEWKYIPVRRLALFIEESLYRGTQWVVFEPNDEPLWAQIRLNIGAFMHNLFRQGAFQGRSPNEAYFVKCGKETTTQNDINLGIVNILVGFAPLKPAEFVIIRLQQMAGQVQA
ncbi:MAG: phage tail sheath subtilisin-like domain-containing protein [Candidatus Competibacteraceae bacterium]